MKSILLGLLTLMSITTYGSDQVKGKCSSLKDGRNSLSFELIQISFEQQTYLLRGTRKSFVSRKNFELDSKYLGVYNGQFYTFSFVAPFIEESTNLLIRKEEFRKETGTDDAFIVNKDGYILDSLSCVDLSH